jgi:tetratricopeptide (TPR) repeat protein
VFADQFLPNLSVFVLGQAAAWYYLRTGRFWIGAASTAALWVLADLLLVARFVFGVSSQELAMPLFLLQGVAFGTLAALLLALWRRRWSATARARPQLFAAAMAQYLRCDHDAAASIFRRLTRADPWDVAAWTALGNVLARSAQPQRARWCYRRAAQVDTRGRFADFLQHQQRLLRDSGPRAKPPAVAEPAAVSSRST